MQVNANAEGNEMSDNTKLLADLMVRVNELEKENRSLNQRLAALEPKPKKRIEWWLDDGERRVDWQGNVQGLGA